MSESSNVLGDHEMVLGNIVLGEHELLRSAYELTPDSAVAMIQADKAQEVLIEQLTSLQAQRTEAENAQVAATNRVTYYMSVLKENVMNPFNITNHTLIGIRNHALNQGVELQIPSDLTPEGVESITHEQYIQVLERTLNNLHELEKKAIDSLKTLDAQIAGVEHKIAGNTPRTSEERYVNPKTRDLMSTYDLPTRSHVTTDLGGREMPQTTLLDINVRNRPTPEQHNELVRLTEQHMRRVVSEEMGQQQIDQDLTVIELFDEQQGYREQALALLEEIRSSFPDNRDSLAQKFTTSGNNPNGFDPDSAQLLAVACLVPIGIENSDLFIRAKDQISNLQSVNQKKGIVDYKKIAETLRKHREVVRKLLELSDVGTQNLLKAVKLSTQGFSDAVFTFLKESSELGNYDTNEFEYALLPGYQLSVPLLKNEKSEPIRLGNDIETLRSEVETKQKKLQIEVKNHTEYAKALIDRAEAAQLLLELRSGSVDADAVKGFFSEKKKKRGKDREAATKLLASLPEEIDLDLCCIVMREESSVPMIVSTVLVDKITETQKKLSDLDRPFIDASSAATAAKKALEDFDDSSFLKDGIVSRKKHRQKLGEDIINANTKLDEISADVKELRATLGELKQESISRYQKINNALIQIFGKGNGRELGAGMLTPEGNARMDARTLLSIQLSGNPNGNGVDVRPYYKHIRDYIAGVSEWKLSETEKKEELAIKKYEEAGDTIYLYKMDNSSTPVNDTIMHKPFVIHDLYRADFKQQVREYEVPVQQEDRSVPLQLNMSEGGNVTLTGPDGAIISSTTAAPEVVQPAQDGEQATITVHGGGTDQSYVIPVPIAPGVEAIDLTTNASGSAQAEVGTQENAPSFESVQTELVNEILKEYDNPDRMLRLLDGKKYDSLVMAFKLQNKAELLQLVKRLQSLDS